VLKPLTETEGATTIAPIPPAPPVSGPLVPPGAPTAVTLTLLIAAGTANVSSPAAVYVHVTVEPGEPEPEAEPLPHGVAADAPDAPPNIGDGLSRRGPRRYRLRA
jgi:hypothetical protein